VYVVPMLNIAAAQGAQVMYAFFLPADQDEPKSSRNSIRQRKGSTLSLLAFLIVVGSLVLNTATTIIATRASIANYPGGHALALFNKRYAESPNGKSFPLPFLRDGLKTSTPFQSTSISGTSQRRAAHRSFSTLTRPHTAHTSASSRLLSLPRIHGSTTRRRTSH
jgi:hypothetical protein